MAWRRTALASQQQQQHALCAPLYEMDGLPSGFTSSSGARRRDAAAVSLAHRRDVGMMMTICPAWQKPRCSARLTPHAQALLRSNRRCAPSCSGSGAAPPPPRQHKTNATHTTLTLMLAGRRTRCTHIASPVGASTLRATPQAQRQGRREPACRVQPRHTRQIGIVSDAPPNSKRRAGARRVLPSRAAAPPA